MFPGLVFGVPMELPFHYFRTSQETHLVNSYSKCPLKTKELPRGMELLSNLSYLDLYRIKMKKLQAGILPKLFRLQFLRLDPSFAVKAEEVACLQKLETLECRFYGLNNFCKYFQTFEDRDWNTGKHQLSKYNLHVGYYGTCNYEVEFDREAYFCGSIHAEEGDVLFLPEALQKLRISSCFTARSLCLENAAELKSLEVLYCFYIEFLLSLSFSPPIFQTLESIYLCHLDNLHTLLSREEDVASPRTTSWLPNGTFSHLKELVICRCPTMKKLFPPSLLPNLQNLEWIDITSCEKMENIIETEDQVEGSFEKESDDDFFNWFMGELSSSSSNPSNGNGYNDDGTTLDLILPKLKFLVLDDLPELKNICSGKMICNSLKKCVVRFCPNLKRLPLSFHVLDNGQLPPPPSLEAIKIWPKEWWTSVELDYPNAKDVLSPLCSFW